jgi:serine protease Do
MDNTNTDNNIKSKSNSKFALVLITTSLIISSTTGIIGGFVGYKIAENGLDSSINDVIETDVQVVKEESAIIDVADKASDSVVSIVITKDVPLYENRTREFDPFNDDLYDFYLENQEREQIGTEERQVGAGTGFIVSDDGLIITNKHVVETEDVSYTVIANNGEKYEAEILAIDTLLDIALVKIDAQDLPALNLGTSADLKVGQTVIAIGNSLGEFSNTVSSGIVSGLSRDIMAGNSQGASTELLTDVIQTDAAINFGNSGGPLLDVSGNVIGVNVAIANDAQNIGFAIPVDHIRDLLKRYEETGSIERPLLGVRYRLLTEEEMEELNLDHGAKIIDGNEENPSIIKDSPADKAGLKDNDIILEINGEKITEERPLFNIIQEKYKGDELELKILREDEELTVEAIL